MEHQILIISLMLFPTLKPSYSGIVITETAKPTIKHALNNAGNKFLSLYQIKYNPSNPIKALVDNLQTSWTRECSSQFGVK